MTMPSSNPVFSRGFGGAGGGSAPQQYGTPTRYDPYAAPSPYAATTTRYMTMDDVVTKTGLSFLVMVIAAAAAWALPDQTALGLALPAVFVAFILGLVISFKQIA